MSHRFIARWRINFFAGLAVVLPMVISLAIVVVDRINVGFALKALSDFALRRKRAF